MDSQTKKALYSIFFILCAVFIGFLVYRTFFTKPPTCTDGILNQHEEGIDCGGECVACALLQLEPLRVAREPKLFSFPSSPTVAYAEVVNPNPNYHANFFRYTLSLYDENDRKIEELVGERSIPAGSRARILDARVVSFPDRVARMELSLGEPEWEEAFSAVRPTLAFVGNPVTNISSSTVRVTGMLKNQGSIFAPSVRVLALLADQYGKELFVSQTILSGVAASEERAFSIAFPSDTALLRAIDPSRTKVFIESE
jgi:hypothetical protein